MFQRTIFALALLFMAAGDLAAAMPTAAIPDYAPLDGLSERPAIEGPARLTILAWLKDQDERCGPLLDGTGAACRSQHVALEAQATYAGPPLDPTAYALAYVRWGGATKDEVAVWRHKDDSYVLVGSFPVDHRDVRAVGFRDGKIHYFATLDLLGGNLGGANYLAEFTVDPTVDPLNELQASGPIAIDSAEPGAVYLGRREKEDIAAPVRDLYADRKLADRVFFPTGSGALAARYLTVAMMSDMRAGMQDPTSYDDGDVRTNTQMTGAVTLLGVGVQKINDGRANVVVFATADVEDTLRTVEALFRMVRINGRWLVDDVEYRGASASLRQLMVGPGPVPLTEPTPQAPQLPGEAAVTTRPIDPASPWYGPSRYWHNRSLMTISPRLGTIEYFRPKRGMAPTVREGTILFKGLIGPDRIEGVAYAFKSGCAPAPYIVNGPGYTDSSGFTLHGLAPVRVPGSCAILHYSQDERNASLRFDPLIEYDE